MPIPVRFAGFESDTFRLSQKGWSLSVRTEREYAYDSFTMRLAIQQNGIFGMSNKISIPFYAIENHIDPNLLTPFAHYGFDMLTIGSSNTMVFPLMEGDHIVARAFENSFEPIDARPQQRGEVDIKNIRWFKPLNPSLKDIIVTPDQVPELLDLILKTQKPTQDELRSRMKSIENYQRFGEGVELKPSHQVEAQIITLNTG